MTGLGQELIVGLAQVRELDLQVMAVVHEMMDYNRSRGSHQLRQIVEVKRMELETKVGAITLVVGWGTGMLTRLIAQFEVDGIGQKNGIDPNEKDVVVAGLAAVIESDIVLGFDCSAVGTCIVC